MTHEWWFTRDDETIVWEGSPRWSAAIGGLTFGIGIAAIAVGAAVLIDSRIAVGAVVGIAIAGWQLLRVRATSYLLTTRAIWLKKGVLAQSVRRVGIDKVQNTASSQSLSGSLFGYGTVTIEVAGGRDLACRRIDDPETVRQTITNRITDADSELPGTLTQWQAVLTTVQDIKKAVK
jgi:Bacterial membrane flanked domain.